MKTRLCRTAAVLLAAAAVLPSLPAAAADPACAPLIAAATPRPDRPYRVTTTMKIDGKTTVMQGVYINNTIYTREASATQWRAVPIKDMKALATLATETLTGCSAGGVELVGTTPTRVWTTRSLDPFTKNPVAHKVWVGVADNRVYRQLVDDVEQVIAYDNVVAPTDIMKGRR